MLIISVTCYYDNGIDEEEEEEERLYLILLHCANIIINDIQLDS